MENSPSRAGQKDPLDVTSKQKFQFSSKLCDILIQDATNKNKIDQIFKTQLEQHVQNTREEVTKYTRYKFRKTYLQQHLNRVQMILNLNMAEGPIYILCILKKLHLHKELFCNELERGKEVKIPQILNNCQLPQSYRFYDTMLSFGHQNLNDWFPNIIAKEKKSRLSKYASQALRSARRRSTALMKTIVKPDRSLEVRNHCKSIQMSEFVQMEKHNDDHFCYNYLNKRQVEKNREQFLEFKVKFAKKHDHLKLKGRGIILMEKLDLQILTELEKQVLKAFVDEGTGQFDEPKQKELVKEFLQLKPRTRSDQTIHLIEELKKSFINHYLPKSNNNPKLALEKLQNQVIANARNIVMTRYNHHNKSHTEYIKGLITSNNEGFQRKHYFVDQKIEEGIRFFDHNYNANQAYIFDIKKILRMNAKKLKFRFEIQDKVDEQLKKLKLKQREALSLAVSQSRSNELAAEKRERKTVSMKIDD